MVGLILATPQLYDKWCCAGQCGDGNLKILVRITTGGDYDRWIDPMRATEDEELRMIRRNPERRATIGPGQFGVAPLISHIQHGFRVDHPQMRVRDRLAGEWTYNLDFDISVLGDPACSDKCCQHEDQSAWEEMSHDAQRLRERQEAAGANSGVETNVRAASCSLDAMVGP